MPLDENSSKLPSSGSVTIKIELLIISLFNLVMLIMFINIDFLEKLYLFSTQHENYELDEIIPLFITISISLAIFSFRRWKEEKELQSMLLEMAMNDELTGVFNRRGLYSTLEDELSRSGRSGRIFSIILLDLDDLKKINDRYGHDVGDKVLSQLANILTQNTRDTDKVARWGGDEFLILCPDTEPDGIRFVANNLESTIKAYEFDVVGKCTVSTGTASVQKEDDLDSMFSRADELLYRAKKAGKNQLTAEHSRHEALEN